MVTTSRDAIDKMVVGDVLLVAGAAAIAGAGVWWYVLPSADGGRATVSARF